MTGTHVKTGEIITIDPGWAVAVQCHTDNEPDITAIGKIRSAMKTPLNLSRLAAIMGTVYAGTYWTGTRMDPSVLASSLVRNGFDWDDALYAAVKTFSCWRGLLVRNSFWDGGNIPRGGVISNSPDILSAGRKELDREILINRWDTNFRTESYTGKYLIYGRAHSINIPIPVPGATSRIFVHKAALNPPPGLWRPLLTPDGERTSTLSGLYHSNNPSPVEPSHSAASGPFIRDNTDGGNFSILHCVSTDFFSGNPDSIPSGNWNCLEWLSNNGAAGWHNIGVPMPDTENILQFYNQDSSPQQFFFKIVCANIPENTELKMEFLDGALQDLTIGKPVCTARPNDVFVSREVQLPPDYEGAVNVTIRTPHGRPLPADSLIDVQMHWVLPPDHPYFNRCVNLVKPYIDKSADNKACIQAGNFIFTGKPMR